MTSRRSLRPPTLVALGVVALVPFVVLRLKLIPVDDPDSFWHVLSGQNVWRTHEVEVTDPFGRFSTNAWVQIDWLSDLAMAGVHAVAGLAGVAWLYATLGIAALRRPLRCRAALRPSTDRGDRRDGRLGGDVREPGVPAADRLLRPPGRHACWSGTGSVAGTRARRGGSSACPGSGPACTACGSSVRSWG